MKKIDQQLLELHNQKKSPGSIQSEGNQFKKTNQCQCPFYEFFFFLISN